MAGTELSGIQAFSFYDPATGDTVQVDGKYVESFDFNQERGGTNSPESPTGGTVAGGDFSELEVTFTDVAGRSQLEQWRANDTPISFCAAGEQAAIQWYETDILNAVEDLPVYDQHADVNRVRVHMVREGHGIHNIYKGTNLLRPVNHQIGSTFLADSWQDGNSDNQADGYQAANGAVNDAFSSDVQTIETNAVGNRLQTPITFPIVGVDLTNAFELTNPHANSQVQISLLFNDFGGSTLQKDNVTFSTTERASVTGSTPSSVYEVVVIQMEQANTGAADVIGGKFPSLRLDGSEGYVEY